MCSHALTEKPELSEFRHTSVTFAAGQIGSTENANKSLAEPSGLLVHTKASFKSNINENVKLYHLFVLFSIRTAVVHLITQIPISLLKFSIHYQTTNIDLRTDTHELS